MRRTRFVPAVLIAAALLVSAGASRSMAATGGWQPVAFHWGPTVTGFQLLDTLALPDRSIAVGTIETTSGHTLPAVQTCRATCDAARLPMLDGIDGQALSVTGTSSSDLWVVGAILESDGPAATSWHFDGTRWSNVQIAAPGGTTLSDVVSNGVNESWATGTQDYGDGARSVLYHRVGSVWSSLSGAPEGPLFPAFCTDWYGISTNRVVVVAGAAVISGDCDGSQFVLKQDGASWRRIDSGLPAGVTLSVAAVVKSQVWVSGRDGNGHLSILRRDSGVWRSVPTAGLPSDAVFGLAGNSAGTAIAYGYRLTSAMAGTWQFDGTRWAALPVPSPRHGIVLGLSIAQGGSTSALVYYGTSPDVLIAQK